MENAADALKMAGDVLLFVLAVSVAIFAFGRVRETADTIIDYRDRETMYIDGNYYYEVSGKSREVGLETIVPAITRAYLENYKIVFEPQVTGNTPIYKVKTNTGEDLDKYTIDLETNNEIEYKNVALANDDQKIEFLKAILYGKFQDNSFNAKSKFELKYQVTLPDAPLFNRIKSTLNSGKKIEEYLGVYYQTDSEDEPDVNKTEKRIITYRIK